MSEFIPTKQLRFVEREIVTGSTYFDDSLRDIKGTVRILQQKWEKNEILFLGNEIVSSYEDEWRDVPLEEEEV